MIDPTIQRKLREALDAAFCQGFEKLFNIHRQNELSERPADAGAQFVRGVNQLIEDYRTSLRSIDDGTFG